MMRGRDVLIHIAMLPVTLAIAGTLIGLLVCRARRVIVGSSHRKLQPCVAVISRGLQLLQRA